jgi:hypothetical protein
VDSYGMALPAGDLDTFLRRHCNGYPPTVYARADVSIDSILTRPMPKAVEKPEKSPTVKKNPDADQPLEYWTERLKNPSAEVRRSAAATLGRLGSAAQEAMPALREALKDENVYVGRAASDALERIKKAIAAEEIKKALDAKKAAALPRKEEPAPQPVAPPPPAGKRLSWAELDKLVSPAVLMIMREF